jgi:eukaryotic-like serine/threonine-protein kinase
MNSERWRQVKALFTSAMELAPAARRQFLESACGGDHELVDEVESLLRYQAVSTAYAISGSRPADRPADTGLEGRRLGTYQLLHKIGHGGMASVYLAIRADDQYRKQVAVKLLSGVAKSEDVVRRFRNERQTLAVLDYSGVGFGCEDGRSAENVGWI